MGLDKRTVLYFNSLVTRTCVLAITSEEKSNKMKKAPDSCPKIIGRTSQKNENSHVQTGNQILRSLWISAETRILKK